MKRFTKYIGSKLSTFLQTEIGVEDGTDNTSGTVHPGKPDCTDCTPDSFTLTWTVPSVTDEIEHYEIHYKEKSDKKWQRYSTSNSRYTATVTGMKENTMYIAKVRAVYNNSESPFSPEIDNIKTESSPIHQLLKDAKLAQDGHPALYRLQSQLTSSCDASMTRKMKIGKRSWRPFTSRKQKTIMLVGATGAGKSTLLDGMVNYLAGVNWTDDQRFTVVELSDQERQRSKDQTVSQTEWITCYNIHPSKSTKLNFDLNIVDTPGFGDTRGISRDKMLVNQMKDFFCNTGQCGVDEINAVCFVTSAALPRLTQTQEYIFQAILSIFGKDIAKHIIILVTFADGKTPPVLDALKAADVPFEEYFTFNNSALFEDNSSQSAKGVSKMFWEMGKESFRNFFSYLAKMEPRSLTLTKEVLIEREKLEHTVTSLLPAVNKGLNKMEEMRNHKAFVKRHNADIMAGKNFVTKATRSKERKIQLDPGVHVTNCIHCHFTCHFPCFLSNDSDKSLCAAMSNGCCNICPKNCSWTQHHNNGYRLEEYIEEYETTSNELKEIYMKGKEGRKEKLSLIQCIKLELGIIKNEVAEKITKIRKSLNRLNEIALKPDPLNDVQYIDLLLESEKIQAKAGFEGRMRSLNELKKQAELTENIKEGGFDPFKRSDEDSSESPDDIDDGDVNLTDEK